MRRYGLTVITEILPDKTPALRETLKKIGEDIEGNGLIGFAGLRSVHFMRWVVLDATEVRGKHLPAKLVLATNHDGPLRDHLSELAENAADGLRAIYAHCKGFPDGASPKAIADYLYRHKRRTTAFYSGSTGRSVDQVRREYELRTEIGNYLRESNPAQDWEGVAPEVLRESIVKEMAARPETAWSLKEYRAPFRQKYGLYVLLATLLVLLAGYVTAWALLPLTTLIATLTLVAAIALYWTFLRIHENRDRAAFRPSDNTPAEIAELHRREDHIVQNQITHLVTVKPGIVRQIALRTVLALINLLAYMVFNRGSLTGIHSIHFARWVLIDGGRRLLFFSNYDGSWESYLGEFIDRAAVGLTGVWSNTEGFPPTKNLIREGARRSVEFKAWVRAKQIGTQVWYSAYPYATITNINNDTGIRTGLRDEMRTAEARAWLQRL